MILNPINDSSNNNNYVSANHRITMCLIDYSTFMLDQCSKILININN